MVTDARGHVVPAGAEPPKRQAFLDLSDSIADVRPVADQAAADTLVTSLTSAGIDPKGLVCYFNSPGLLYVYTGSAWAPLAMRADFGKRSPIVAYGTTSLSGKADDTRRKTITYPAGRFPGSPIVMLQNLTGFNTGGSMDQVEWPSNRSSTSMQINVSRGNTTEVTMSWLAVYYNPPANASLQAVSAVDALAVEPTTYATCHTDGCPNQGIAIEVSATHADIETGEQVPVDAIECGVCGADITATAREAS